MLDLLQYDPDNHTLTWLIYQILLKFVLEYGINKSIIINDLIEFMSKDFHRFLIDLSILTWLFYYGWRTKEIVNDNDKIVPSQKEGTRVFIISVVLSIFLLKLSLNLIPWLLIIFIILLLTINKIFKGILLLLINKNIRWSVIIITLFVLYKTFIN